MELIPHAVDERNLGKEIFCMEIQAKWMPVSIGSRPKTTKEAFSAYLCIWQKKKNTEKSSIQILPPC